MALPFLVKHIYNGGSEEVIRRGKKIHALGNVELIEHDELMGTVVFRVKDDTYATFYKVYISNFKDEKSLSLRCTCPYNLSEVCRHKAGALFQLQEMLDKNILGDKTTVYNQKHTVVKMKLLDLKLIRMLSSPDSFEAAEEFLRTQKATIIEAKDEKVLAEVDFGGKKHKVLIQKNEERNFDTSCTDSNDTTHPLCVEKVIVFLQLLKNYGSNYFDSIRNWDGVKNKLLAMYGYSLDDNLKGKFEFTYQDGKPFLRVLDTSIKRVVAIPLPEPRPRPAWADMPIAAATAQPIARATLEEPKKSDLKLGIVITNNELQYPYIQIEAVQGEATEDFAKYVGKVEKLDLNKFINTEVFSEEDKMLLQQVRKLMAAEVNKYLTRNSPFSGFWENIVQQHDDELPEETRHLINEYLQPKFKKLFAELTGSNFAFYLPPKKTFTTDNLLHAELSAENIALEFTVNYKDAAYEVECRVK
ncbi:MAG: helicase SNF2, partial [Chitinophagaceae bacterium]|nr:helicase SNF2 [Chitinophagaceae bacterium]